MTKQDKVAIDNCKVSKMVPEKDTIIAVLIVSSSFISLLIVNFIF